jgi:hypothetical protein
VKLNNLYRSSMVMMFLSLSSSASAFQEAAAFCRPCVDRFVLTGDLLYWNALQGGIECGCGPHIDHPWDLGYQVGITYDLVSMSGTVSAQFTSFETSTHQSGDDEQFADFHLNYYAVDLLWGYDFYQTACGSSSGFIGVRGIRTKEHLEGFFKSCECACVTPDEITFAIDHKEKFWGVGPEVGLSGEIELGCNFGLYGTLDVGLLYGEFKIKVEDFETIPDPTDSGACCLHRTIDSCQIFTDCALGIKWERCFCENKEVLFKLGLEHKRYFNHNQIGGYGDLCLSGVNFSAAVRF